MTEALKAKLKTLPAAPGVYFHKNSDGEVIYVGKAAVLKNRVRQYFQSPDKKDPKTRALVSEIAMTDWIVVDTEVDALFLESEMVKRYQPKWNVLLRDDKSSSYVRIDMKSEIPYVSTTRNPLDDQAEYYGPYYEKHTVATALRILRPIFPYYTKPYTGKKTLDTDLGLTPGIEIGKSSPKEYKQNLRRLISYLKGNRQKLIRDLEKDMHKAAEKGNYEQAAQFRNQFFGLRGLATKIVFSDQEFLDISNDQALRGLQKLLKLSHPPRRIDGFDISHQSGTNVVASQVTFINGVADRTKYRRFKLRNQKNNDFANMREIITRRLNHLKDWGTPDLILIDGGQPQLRAVKDILDPTGITYIGLAKEFEVIIIPGKFEQRIPNIGDGCENYQELLLPKHSHVVKLLQRIRDESHRFAIQYHTLLKRKSMLK
ncbi:UvrB/UvrC motif-containing protein [Candidatus Saccharibacteria bacterium]|nr:UvrB/UvrC motif-containing protein [Candidatus Saccharibacteria bacterium]